MGFILANNRKIVLVLALLLLGAFVYSNTFVKSMRSNTVSSRKEVSYPALKTPTLPKVEQAQKKEAALVKVNKTKTQVKSKEESEEPILIPPMPGKKPIIIDPPGQPIRIPEPPHDPIIIGE